MQLKVAFFMSMSLFLAHNVMAEIVPTAHRSHCDTWKNGKCVEGKLTKLSLIMKSENDLSQEVKGSTCDQVCKEGCPKCSYCEMCDLCDFYDDDACHGVPYFEEKETCSIAKTNSCCQVCEVQCFAPEGVCGEKGFCQNKPGIKGTDILTQCVEKTTEEKCLPCQGEE